MKVPDLSDLELSGVHAWSGDPQPIATAAAATKLRLYSADLRAVDSKAALLAVISKGLKLTEHFGNNWDALADSVEDGAWLGKTGCVVVLQNAGPYRKAHGVDWTTFEDILAEASDYWRERHKPFWVFVS
jgi:RNAse (barnase) inhibitor barstar